VAGLDGRPFPPGDYPVVIVGSGPGGLQTSYCLSRLGVDHAVLSSDDGPGGMFRRFPVFQRLLSATKPDAPEARGTRAYEWYDHNSLLADEAALQALMPSFMDRSFVTPARREMEAGLAAFAERAGVRVRYGCRWEATRPEGDGFVLATSEGEYRCRAAVFALGVTDPWKMAIPGIESVPHYGETERPETYEGKKVVIIGKRNSAFELASGLLQWARQVILVSPRPVQASVLALSTVSARYLQPLEDAGIGGGTFVVDAAIESVERTASGYRVRAQGTTRPGAIQIEADVAIAATGFRTPLVDLPDLGVETVAQGRIPAQTPFWESATVPGIYFAGNASQGAPGLRKHGVGASSPNVHGFRYNARVLARHIAETRFGVAVPRERVERADLVDFLLGEVTRGPELWAQKAYLARVVYEDGTTDVRPLADWLDRPGGPSVAATVEMNAEGAVYPVLYVAADGDVQEHPLEADHLHDYERDEYRRAVKALL
jgi:thioredoxin reductase